jgi:2-methylisocitrate lyase-like PEP mutase family enzyme
MVNQIELAEAFADLHIKGKPLILFNVWDAGTAKAAADIGAKAIATGSWAVAAANGFDDGEKIPFDLALVNLERIVASVDLPVTFDIEGGYAKEPDRLGANIARAIKIGAVGVNFEDRVVDGEGLYSIDEQSARIRAIRKAADDLSVPIFINARTDVFLPLDPATHIKSHLDEAINRTAAYSEAGASGFFAPGLVNPDFIGRLCKESPLPVNIMVWPGIPSSMQLADLGVARISYGGGSYVAAMEAFKEAGLRALGWNEIAEKVSA